MRLPQWTVSLLLTLTLTTVALATPVAANPTEVPGLPVYISLGDSWAYGEGATDPAVGGYVARLHRTMQEEFDCLPASSDMAADGCRHLQLLNLARPATDTLPGVTAPIVAVEQIPTAISILKVRNQDSNPRNDVELITMHVGGNDAFEPIVEACIAGLSPICLETLKTVIGEYEAVLDDIVGQLREAAGDDTPIVLGTYDNTVPYCYLGGVPGAKELGDLMLEGSPDGSISGLHDAVRRVAATHEADVAEVFRQLEPGDFVGGLDCLHLVDTGHTRVAEAFGTAAGG